MDLYQSINISKQVHRPEEYSRFLSCVGSCLLGQASCRTETRGESEKNGRFEGKKKIDGERGGKVGQTAREESSLSSLRGSVSA